MLCCSVTVTAQVVTLHASRTTSSAKTTFYISSGWWNTQLRLWWEMSVAGMWLGGVGMWLGGVGMWLGGAGMWLGGVGMWLGGVGIHPSLPRHIPTYVFMWSSYFKNNRFKPQVLSTRQSPTESLYHLMMSMIWTVNYLTTQQTQWSCS